MPDTPPTPERTSTRQPNPPRNVESKLMTTPKNLSKRSFHERQVELLERKESIRNELLKQALTKEQLQLSDSPVITKRGQQQIRTIDDQFAWKQSIEKKRQEKVDQKVVSLQETLQSKPNINQRSKRIAQSREPTLDRLCKPAQTMKTNLEELRKRKDIAFGTIISVAHQQNSPLSPKKDTGTANIRSKSAGRPNQKTNDPLSTVYRLYAMDRSRIAIIDKQRELKEKQEINQCSFQPDLSKPPQPQRTPTSRTRSQSATQSRRSQLQNTPLRNSVEQKPAQDRLSNTQRNRSSTPPGSARGRPQSASPQQSQKNNLQTPLQPTDQDKHSSQTQLLPNQQSPALSSNPAAKSTTSLRQEPLSAQVSLSSDFVPDLHNTLDSPSPATSPTLHTPHTPTSSTPVPALSPPQRASSPSFTKERMLFDELESQLSTSRSTARLKSPSSRGIPPLATFKGLRLSQLSFEDRTNLCEMKKDKWLTHERARVKAEREVPDQECTFSPRFFTSSYRKDAPPSPAPRLPKAKPQSSPSKKPSEIYSTLIQ
ncbi:hypothetical protein BLNAU_15065 [Blattamonas nauphoetae]|uniref:Uncharacterized protein n=1 Tax=Blattamonas nauphoetae TaxID=2049346 RepID=A0ABQ9XF52_9EUKA|nr:hypothetical protein BLNAU_15065 [Blattamonas nauphoetae]